MFGDKIPRLGDRARKIAELREALIDSWSNVTGAEQIVSMPEERCTWCSLLI